MGTAGKKGGKKAAKRGGSSPDQVDELLERAKFLKLTSDLSFKEYFKKSEKVLISILRAFLPLPPGSSVVSAHVVDPESAGDGRKDGGKGGASPKTFVLDLKARILRRGPDTKGGVEETVNVEMQAWADPALMERALAYACRTYAGQLKRGEDYGRLAPVYSLVFTTEPVAAFEDVKGVRDEHVHVCTLRRLGSPDATMTRGLSFVVVELSKFRRGFAKARDARDPRAPWCWLLKNSAEMGREEYEGLLEKGGDMAEAARHLLELSRDERTRMLEEAREKQLMDERTRMDTRFREGGEEKQMEIALRMLGRGMAPADVAALTGLSRKAVDGLRRKARSKAGA